MTDLLKLLENDARLSPDALALMLDNAFVQVYPKEVINVS